MISYLRLMTLCGDFQPQANKVSPYDINNSSKWVFVHCAHLFPYQELSHSLARVDNSKILIVALIIQGFAYLYNGSDNAQCTTHRQLVDFIERATAIHETAKMHLSSTPHYNIFHNCSNFSNSFGSFIYGQHFQNNFFRRIIAVLCEMCSIHRLSYRIHIQR